MSLVEREIRGHCAVLCLCDPRRRNILSLPLVDELESAFDEVESATGIKALIITGEPPAFCAGADLADLEAASGGDETGLKRIYRGFLRVAESPLVTIAAVNGPAVGAGMNLALACDVRIAGESALFDPRFLALALHPGGGHTWMLERAAGWQTAVATLLLGQPMTGALAAEKGLAWTCVADCDLIDAALDMAQKVAQYPATLLRRVKATMQRNLSVNEQAEAVALELEQQVWSLRQQEFLEFLAATKKRITGAKSDNDSRADKSPAQKE